MKPKERLFVETYFKTDFNGTESVKKVYGDYSEGFSRVKAHRLLTKSNIAQAIEVKRQTLREALEAQGVDPTKVALKVDQLLDSEDNKDVNNGLKHATNIYGIEDLTEKHKVNTTYNFIFNEQTQAEIRKVDEIIKAKLINPDATTP